MKDICERKQSLFHQWQDAMETYSKAVALLTGQTDNVEEPEEYSKLKERADIALNLAVQLRQEVDRHIEMHGC